MTLGVGHSFDQARLESRRGAELTCVDAAQSGIISVAGNFLDAGIGFEVVGGRKFNPRSSIFLPIMPHYKYSRCTGFCKGKHHLWPFRRCWMRSSMFHGACNSLKGIFYTFQVYYYLANLIPCLAFSTITTHSS